MRVIKTNEELEDFSTALRRQKYAAIDTEFMRERTYWPILCLIQAAADDLEAIIDPLVEDLDLTPFLEVLTDPNVVKIFHAARQDLEIFYKLTEQVPAPLFDTQIAAMACGYGDQIGYEPLMRGLLNAQIDKGSRFTDWSRRPLSNAQLSYALSDVTHLRDAYPLLKDNLQKQDRTHWVEAETEALYDPSLYRVEPELAWRRLKLKNVKAKELGPLVKLAEWREQEAQSRDVPRNRILKDEAIFELARLQPQSAKELSRARSIPNGYERSNAATSIIEAVKAGIETPRAQLPAVSRDNRQKPPADVTDLLKVLLKRQCAHFDVAPKLIASASDLEEIALNDDADVPALKGWRREVFGELALQLKRGEIALKLKNGVIDITPSGD